MRRLLSSVLWGAAALAAGLSPSGAEAAHVTVISSGSVKAHVDAVAAFRESMEASGIEVAVAGLRPASGGAAPRASLHAPTDLLVTFGSTAAAAVAGSGGDTPMIASMILADAEFQKTATACARRLVAVVSLDVPPAVAFARLRAAFPDRRRLTVVYNPANAPLDSDGFLAAARANGIALDMVQCTEPRCVLEAVASRRGRADYVWCLPDASLYPPVSVTPLLMASIRARVPVIGFSESFVGAGALAGFYADPGEVGRQTAEMAKALLEGAPVKGVTAPKTLHFAINLRISQLLGVQWRKPPGGEVHILR